MSSSLADRTLLRATAGIESGQGTCLPELVKLLHALSTNALEIPIQELAALIEKDASILAKVIGAANTLGYNPSAIPIATVTQALHVIGFERVRTLAMSLLLLEQTQRSQTDEEQRESASLALCSGLIAQAAAEEFPGVDAEQAFVCASLRNFGRIVLSTFMSEEYRQAKQLAAGLPSDDAYRQVFGITPLELGHALLKAARLPGAILATLQSCDPEKLAATASQPDTRLLGMSDFALQLAELSFNSQLPAKEFAERSEELAQRYHAFLPQAEKLLEGLLKKTETRLSEFMRGFGIKNLPTTSLRRLKERVARIDPPIVKPVQTETKSAQPVAVAAAPNVIPISPESTRAWSSGIERLQAMMDRPGRPLSEVFTLALRIVSEGFEAPDCALFAARSGVQGYSLVEARGQLAHQSGAKPVRADERTVFGICLSRRENVLIHDATDAKIVAYLPTWLRSQGAPRSFVLLPLFHEQQIHGLILSGWPTPRQIVISNAHSTLIRTLLAMVSQACARQGRPSTPLPLSA